MLKPKPKPKLNEFLEGIENEEQSDLIFSSKRENFLSIRDGG